MMRIGSGGVGTMREREARGGVERVKLHLRALAPAGADEHVDVVGRGAEAFGLYIDPFGYTSSTMRSQASGPIARRHVVRICTARCRPVVDDVLEDIGVPAPRKPP
jgi:hypothetical protein